MEMNQSGLKLHTRQIPEDARSAPEQKPKKRGVFRNADRPRILPTFRRSSAERILRDTAVACALLTTVMALKNIDTPFTNRVTSALSQAISMDISLDGSLGQLSFVENIMPESALVFFHMGGKEERKNPVEGQAIHPWSKEQPWLEYQTMDGAVVRALKGGTVSAATQSASGDYTVLIDHGDGSQSVYAYLVRSDVATGDKVNAGSALGVTGSGENARLYFEYRVDSEPADPFAAADRKA